MKSIGLYSTSIDPRDTSQRTFIGIGASLFAASTALTIAWCNSMSAMRDMPMPGGWSMSMMWMRMPGESWPAGAMQFIGMWIVMMIAMMLPSVLPMLWSYRQLAAAANRERSGLLTLLAGSAYFFVWALLGAVVFLLGTTLAALEMQVPSMARAIPAAAGIVVTIAGALQFSAWKSRSLICCRILPLCCDGSIGTARAAWRIGVRLGLRCVHCCLGMTAVLVVIGVMDLRAMVVLTAAISAERLAPAGQRVARLTGAATLIFGMVLTVRAAIA